jgi:hypothetical protein
VSSYRWLGIISVIEVEIMGPSTRGVVNNSCANFLCLLKKIIKNYFGYFLTDSIEKGS